MKVDSVEIYTTEENLTPRDNNDHVKLSNFLENLPSEICVGYEQFMKSSWSSNDAYKYVIRPLKNVQCPYKEQLLMIESLSKYLKHSATFKKDLKQLIISLFVPVIETCLDSLGSLVMSILVEMAPPTEQELKDTQIGRIMNWVAK